MVAAAERDLNHPFARALENSGLRHTPGDSSEHWHREALRILPGKGIWTRVRNSNGRTHELVIVSRSATLKGVASSDSTVPVDDGIVFLLDGTEVGSATFEEEFRDGRSAALHQLAAMGIELHLLSGDTHSRAVRAGIASVQGALTPAEKLDRVIAWQRDKRKVLFVGDGINDAPAMAAADIAIAVDEGTALARAVASGVWDGRSLRAIPAALEIARQTVRRIRTNFRWAISYNTIGMALAAAGFLHPVSAALLMVASSAQVTWRAMALLGEANVDGLVEEAPHASSRSLSPQHLRNREPLPSGRAGS